MHHGWHLVKMRLVSRGYKCTWNLMLQLPQQVLSTRGPSFIILLLLHLAGYIAQLIRVTL
ncbi:hypothetical protein L208DRAFT_1400652 [Tricholoma matsutake]|nr:hypothetical protein L208DRAFT_1400652 [Tricholoma matsutake 945]